MNKEVNLAVEALVEMVPDIFAENLLLSNQDKLTNDLSTGISGALHALLLILTQVQKMVPEDKQIEITQVLSGKIITFLHALIKGFKKKTDFMLTNNTKATKNLLITSTSTRKMGKTQFEFIYEDYSANSGVTGILYTLIRAIELVPSLRAQTDLLNSIEKSVKKILSFFDRQTWMHEESTGASTANSSPKRRNSNSFEMTFCHGLSGLIPLLTKAAIFFPHLELELTQKACDLGQNIWKEGLRLKGNGLCHGTTGNAYMLHNLSRYFNFQARKS
jgi:hypothetical protein